MLSFFLLFQLEYVLDTDGALFGLSVASSQALRASKDPSARIDQNVEHRHTQGIKTLCGQHHLLKSSYPLGLAATGTQDR